MFQDLISDISSGSSEILKRAIASIRTSLIAGADPGLILTNLDLLCRTHPSMAILQNLRNHLHKTGLTIEHLDSWFINYQNHEISACKHFTKHLEQFDNILIHSNSGLLRRSLQEMQRKIRVFCTESRPALEGKTLAEQLVKFGHSVTLLTDIASFSAIGKVDALAFGSDALTKRGIVNKIGTSPLALFGKYQGKQSFFIATSEKWMKDWNDALLLRQGAESEIYSGMERIRVENFYFDLTPPELIAGLFLENGAVEEMFL